MYFLPDIKTINLEESKDNLCNILHDLEKASNDKLNTYQREYYFFRINNLLNDEHIGEMGYSVKAVNKCGLIVHLGYFLHKKYWGQGYASEALAAVVSFAFKHGVYQIDSGCNAANLASQKVLEKAGFAKLGATVDRIEYRLTLK
jgi:RimJ/RimL family protein N-acetyltransferase